MISHVSIQLVGHSMPKDLISGCLSYQILCESIPPPNLCLRLPSWLFLGDPLGIQTYSPAQNILWHQIGLCTYTHSSETFFEKTMIASPIHLAYQLHGNTYFVEEWCDTHCFGLFQGVQSCPVVHLQIKYLHGSSLFSWISNSSQTSSICKM